MPADAAQGTTRARKRTLARAVKGVATLVALASLACEAGPAAQGPKVAPGAAARAGIDASGEARPRDAKDVAARRGPAAIGDASLDNEAQDVAAGRGSAAIRDASLDAAEDVAAGRRPAAIRDASLDAAEDVAAGRGPAAIRDASLEAARADPYPSLRHYPDGDSRLREALAAHAGPREVLVALSRHMAPHRWPDALDWDRHGFIDLHGARPGFVTRVAGALVPQTGGRCDLGCAGGFLEGVRLTLSPGLAIDELDRCDPDAAAVAGGPGRCDPEHEYGWLALAAIAARLAPTQLPEGPRLLEIGPTEAEVIDRLAAAGAMHLCTVSHAATAQGGARFYHHMMIVLGTPGGAALDVFDTTGARGVSLVTMTRERFFRYCTTQLAANAEFRYVSRSARLTCLAVAADATAMLPAAAGRVK